MGYSRNFELRFLCCIYLLGVFRQNLIAEAGLIELAVAAANDCMDDPGVQVSDFL
jgi:hypothetical protein